MIATQQCTATTYTPRLLAWSCAGASDSTLERHPWFRENSDVKAMKLRSGHGQHEASSPAAAAATAPPSAQADSVCPSEMRGADEVEGEGVDAEADDGDDSAGASDEGELVLEFNTPSSTWPSRRRCPSAPYAWWRADGDGDGEADEPDSDLNDSTRSVRALRPPCGDGECTAA
jgi:hypothetical protein